jgi:hypothetical protein
MYWVEEVSGRTVLCNGAVFCDVVGISGFGCIAVGV